MADISPTTSFRRSNYIKITIFGFALTALWQSLHTIILPLRILDFVPETQKNTYLGLLTFTGLILWEEVPSPNCPTLFIPQA